MGFILICGILYEQGLKGREGQYQQLKEQWMALQKERQESLIFQQNLKLQINSQSDLAWLELVLMKNLGLVPDNQQKIFFSEMDDQQ